jgi:hypothetical protein
MGWSDFQAEVKSGKLELFGEKWFGKSRVASIKKQAKELLISSR